MFQKIASTIFTHNKIQSKSLLKRFVLPYKRGKLKFYNLSIIGSRVVATVDMCFRETHRYTPTPTSQKSARALIGSVFISQTSRPGGGGGGGVRLSMDCNRIA